LALRVVEAATGRERPDEVMAMLAVAGAKTWVGLDQALRLYAEQSLEGEWLSWLVAACSGDGHRRESAVVDPVMGADEGSLPVLVLRTAEWVPQVRDRARRSLADALRMASPVALPAAASVAVAIGSWARGGHALNAVTEALATAPDDVLERLLRRGDAKIRIEALTALVDLGRPEAGAAHLAERSAMMRATAQWAVRRAGRAPAAIYRDALTSERPPSRVRALVAGLGVCGTRQDVDVLLPFLEHSRPRVRAEAVRAVRRLGGSITLPASGRPGGRPGAS
jgi:hypothetical protein